MAVNVSHQPFSWTLNRRGITRTRLPALMGILNVTPDSFSDGGKFNAIDAAVARALQMAEDGADIIDIGGESTRPGAEPVSLDEELNRTIPVIRQLAGQLRIPISIDTTKANVARQALDAGAEIVNDISGLTFDRDMLEVCRKADAGICVMHIQGTPQTMQQNPQYGNVVTEVIEFLQQQVDRCLMAGIPPERMCVDPGIGFGKTADHNLELLKAVPQIQQTLQRPVLIGHSRKRFLSKIPGRPVEENSAGTIGVAVALAELGTDVLRIHDVRAIRDALVAWDLVARDMDG
ncbi:MAG TPA: dihydropteroate synthase [Planctomycetaceae bacterium]|nr:dihydropteroate synthase [Planctomycetaceae bacterium]